MADFHPPEHQGRRGRVESTMNLRPLKALTVETVGHGTRFELVICNDPNGGWLVAWSAGNWLGRAYPGDLVHLVHLAGKKLRPLDHQTLLTFLKENEATLKGALAVTP